ncbi:MAG: hypothetical protein GTO13_15440 [Proteobacteria bacterium]|nr:hypothetical protein [Pseudomonadota bacterium]
MARKIREGKSTDLPDEGDSRLMIYYPDTTDTWCFSLDDINNDIKEGDDYNNLNPMEVLDDSRTVGGETFNHRILCNDLQFMKDGDRVTIKFSLRHDLDNGDGPDDLIISFGSTVKLRG